MSCDTHTRHELGHDEEALLTVCRVRLVADAQVGDNPPVPQCAEHIVLLFKALDSLCTVRIVYKL